MTRSPRFLFSAAALALAVSIGFSTQRSLGEEQCGEYGTSVIFADSPAEAAKQALQEEKLVFVLHVSGEFEESGLT